MVSHPENGSDSPIGSNRDRGRDKYSSKFVLELIPLGVVEVNKLVRSHPSVLSYSKEVS